ncbi:MAG: hypothetical protein Q9198_010389 [Flavoplaca austrocitrina]
MPGEVLRGSKFSGRLKTVVGEFEDLGKTSSCETKRPVEMRTRSWVNKVPLTAMAKV